MSETLHNIEFFDPFAEGGEEAFDPIASHEQITARYMAKEVEHDYTADRFVSDTQALIFDSQLVGKFAEAQRIAMRMHEICGEDHNVGRSVNANETFKHSLTALLGDGQHAGHGEQNKANELSAQDKKNRHNKKSKSKTKSIFQPTKYVLFESRS